MANYDYHTMRLYDLATYPDNSIFLVPQVDYEETRFAQTAFGKREDILVVPYEEFTSSDLIKKRFRRLAFPGSHLGKDGFDLDKFLSYNAGKDIFIHPSFGTKKISKHPG